MLPLLSLYYQVVELVELIMEAGSYIYMCEVSWTGWTNGAEQACIHGEAQLWMGAAFGQVGDGVLLWTNKCMSCLSLIYYI
jgi:hypothetical protein